MALSASDQVDGIEDELFRKQFSPVTVSVYFLLIVTAPHRVSFSSCPVLLLYSAQYCMRCLNVRARTPTKSNPWRSVWQSILNVEPSSPCVLGRIGHSEDGTGVMIDTVEVPVWLLTRLGPVVFVLLPSAGVKETFGLLVRLRSYHISL